MTPVTKAGRLGNRPVTTCSSAPLGKHDYSRPAHNTPQTARESTITDDCCFQLADLAKFGPCRHDHQYEVVVFSAGTHDWIHGLACEPCTATLRDRARYQANALASVHKVQSPKVARPDHEQKLAGVGPGTWDESPSL